ncbi:MAG: hypothetical protein KBD78_07275 [Oligoflexales bacterium]|nr:hypothetical protein [Oligoflexales bacterium]
MIHSMLKQARILLTLIVLLFASQTLHSSRLMAQVELEDVMKDMDTLFKNLKREFTDPSKKDSSLLKVSEFKKLILQAATMTPKFIGSMPEGQRPAALLAYVNSMELLYAETAKLEFAIALERPKDLLSLLYNNIIEIRDDGHEEFDPSPF